MVVRHQVKGCYKFFNQTTSLNKKQKQNNNFTVCLTHSPVTPVIESSVLIEETEEQPHTDGLHPENYKQ